MATAYLLIINSVPIGIKWEVHAAAAAAAMFLQHGLTLLVCSNNKNSAPFPPQPYQCNVCSIQYLWETLESLPSWGAAKSKYYLVWRSKSRVDVLTCSIGIMRNELGNYVVQLGRYTYMHAHPGMQEGRKSADIFKCSKPIMINPFFFTVHWVGRISRG